MPNLAQVICIALGRRRSICAFSSWALTLYMQAFNSFSFFINLQAQLKIMTMIFSGLLNKQKRGSANSLTVSCGLNTFHPRGWRTIKQACNLNCTVHRSTNSCAFPLLSCHFLTKFLTWLPSFSLSFCFRPKKICGSICWGISLYTQKRFADNILYPRQSFSFHPFEFLVFLHLQQKKKQSCGRHSSRSRKVEKRKEEAKPFYLLLLRNNCCGWWLFASMWTKFLSFFHHQPSRFFVVSPFPSPRFSSPFLAWSEHVFQSILLQRDGAVSNLVGATCVPVYELRWSSILLTGQLQTTAVVAQQRN